MRGRRSAEASEDADVEEEEAAVEAEVAQGVSRRRERDELDTLEMAQPPHLLSCASKFPLSAFLMWPRAS